MLVQIEPGPADPERYRDQNDPQFRQDHDERGGRRHGGRGMARRETLKHRRTLESVKPVLHLAIRQLVAQGKVGLGTVTESLHRFPNICLRAVRPEEIRTALTRDPDIMAAKSVAMAARFQRSRRKITPNTPNTATKGSVPGRKSP